MFRTLVSLLLAVSISGASYCQDPEPHIKAQIDRLLAWQTREIERGEKIMSELKESLKENRKDAKRRREIGARIDLVELDLKALKTWSLPPAKIDSFKMANGQLGELDAAELKVISIVGDKVLVVPMKTMASGTGLSGFREYGRELQQSLLRPRSLESGEPFFIYGMDIEGVTDGQAFSPKGLFEVTGTEQYTSVERAVKTVFSVQWYDAEAIAPHLERIKKTAAAKPAKIATPGSSSRTWTDTTGSFSVIAEFVKVEDDLVHLKKSDGSIVKVPEGRLSNDDLHWIRDHSGETKKLAPVDGSSGRRDGA